MAESRRAATLIACPNVPGEKYLPGTINDVHRMQDFLISPFGGAWKMSEVEILIDPPKTKVLGRMNAIADFDYALTLFTGHGCHNTRNSDDAVCLPDSYVSISQLAPKVTRQTMIVDACRELYDVQELRMTKFASIAESARKTPSLTYSLACRQQFEWAFMGAPEGRSTMYSCSLDQTSGESSSGGYFLTALIDLNLKWAEENWSAKGEGDHPTLYRPLPEAFQPAFDYVLKSHYPQRPELQDGKRAKSYPFAIS